MIKFNPNETMLKNYIQDKLSPKDTEQLELWLADHPEVMQDLELDIMFSHSKEAFTKPKQQKHNNSFNFLEFLSSKKLIPINLFVYGLVLFFLFSGINNKYTNEGYSEISFLDLDKKRGLVTTEYTLPHHTNKGLAIRFFPDNLNSSYKVVVKSSKTNQEMVFEDLKTINFDYITIMLNSNRMNNNQWRVMVYNSRNQLEQDYLININ